LLMNLVCSLVTFVSQPNRRLKVCYWREGDGDNFRVRFEIKQILRVHDLASHPGDFCLPRFIAARLPIVKIVVKFFFSLLGKTAWNASSRAALQSVIW